MLTCDGFRFFVKDGGLASYGVDLPEQQRRAATYADRILRGAIPGDLPVQLPTKFEFGSKRKYRQGPWTRDSAGAARDRRRGCRIRILFASLRASACDAVDASSTGAGARRGPHHLLLRQVGKILDHRPQRHRLGGVPDAWREYDLWLQRRACRAAGASQGQGDGRRLLRTRTREGAGKDPSRLLRLTAVVYNVLSARSI